jgi:hypothetical protein
MFVDKSTGYGKLLQLKRVLDKVAKKPSGAFFISRWGSVFSNKLDMLSYLKRVKDEKIREKDIPPCQTVCCVAGWAGLDPWFQKRGFTLDLGSEGMQIPTGYVGVSTLAQFFDISIEESWKLFYNGPNNKYGRTTLKEIRIYLNTLIKKYKLIEKIR